MKRLLLVLLLIALTGPAIAAPECLNKQEARKKWPNRHIYWHTSNRCWDTNPRSSKRYRIMARAEAPKKKPLTADHVVTDDMLRSAPMTIWPEILPLEDYPNPDLGRDGCCWPPLEDNFENRWNSMYSRWWHTD